MKNQISDAWVVRGGCFFPYRGLGDWLRMSGKTINQLLCDLKKEHPNLKAQDFIGEWKKVADDGSLVNAFMPNHELVAR